MKSPSHGSRPQLGPGVTVAHLGKEGGEAGSATPGHSPLPTWLAPPTTQQGPAVLHLNSFLQNTTVTGGSRAGERVCGWGWQEGTSAGLSLTQVPASCSWN